MARLPPLPFLPLLVGALLAAPVSAYADDQSGYFSDGNKQLTFVEPGNRSSAERITILSLFGAGVLAGSVGTYYALDSRSLSDEVSASGIHTGLAWSRALEDTRKDALRSRTVAQVGLGIGGGFLLAGAVAYIVTSPDDEVGYQDWQSRSFAAPTRGGALLGRSWTF